VNGNDLEALISNVFANASRGGLEKNKEPAPHADPAAGSHASIFKNNGQDKATMPVNSNITAEPTSAEMRMYSNVLGFDGVTFELQASDPVSSKYELPPFRAATRLRHIHENLFAYIYAHMVLEQVADRYGDEVPEEMPDIDVSAALQDSYQMATRFHSWRLHIGAGLGGEKGAASAGNDGNAWQGQWRTELHSALVELRRLAVHGPDPELLDKAVGDYRKKNQKATDSFYDLETFEIVEQLYGEIGHVNRQQFNTWHSPAVIEEDEVLMTHPSMMTAAFHSIQAEAGLLWDSILASVYSASFGDNVEEKARSASILASIRQRETKLSSENSFEKHVLRTSGRALFTVASAPVHSGKGEGAESMRFMGAKSTVGINQYTLRAVVLSVAELALPEKKSSLTTLKSDNEIFFLDKEDDARWQTSVRHRKYVRRPVQPIKSSSTLRKVRRKERRLADKKTPRSQLPLSAATLFSRAREATAAEAVFQHVIGSHEEQTRSHAHVRSHAGQAKLRLGKSMNSHGSLAFLEKEQPVSNVSDSVAALFRTSLGNELGEMASFETFTNRGNSLIDLERLKTKFVSAMEVNAYLDSASAKSTFKEGASLVSSDKKAGVFRYQLLNGIGVNVKPMRSGDAKIPSVHRGELRMEIVSLGGKATLPASLVGGCDVVEASGSSGKSGAGTVGGGDVGGDAKSKGQEGSSGEFQGVQYYHRGTPFRDEEEFSADTIAAASENAGEFSSQWSDLQNLVNSVAEDKSLPGPPSAPSLSCSEEHMVISVLLLGKCKVHSTCVPQAVPASIFLPTLSLARVAMRPMFTSRSIRRAFAAAVDATASRKRDHDPSSAATSNGVEKILRMFLDNSTAFGGQRDHRLRRVMPEDIGRINPLELTDWAREQFVPERMEINIVGDIPDRRGLLAALNLIFGTIPRFNATAYSLDHNGVEKKVGFDPYDPMDAKYFERSWPARLNKPTELSEQACFVRDANPRRAFVNVLVPSFDMLQTRGSAMRYAVDQMASRLLSRAIRMHNGFSYFTHLESFHSSLFPGWGFWHGAWLTGNQYAVRDGKADPLNVRASADVGTIALTSSLKRAPRKGDTGGNGLNEYYFKADKALLLGKLRAKFQSTEPWLELLRGMSLSLPANMAKAIGKAAGDETTMRDVREASLLEELQVLTYKEFTRWTQKNAPPSSIELVALKSIVETVDDRGAKEPLMARVECDPNA
jgi:hypothetical protein